MSNRSAPPLPPSLKGGKERQKQFPLLGSTAPGSSLLAVELRLPHSTRKQKKSTRTVREERERVTYIIERGSGEAGLLPPFSSVLYKAAGRADSQKSSPKEISPFNSLSQFIYSGVSRPEKIQQSKVYPLVFPSEMADLPWTHPNDAVKIDKRRGREEAI